ncbi:MAG: DUF504 domain-containing protein [Nitrososphaeraceae archaeon]
MGKKKGRLREILSKALYHEDIHSYTVSYRDFERIVQVSLNDFLCISNNLETIPITRIIEVWRNDEMVYKKMSSMPVQP